MNISITTSQNISKYKKILLKQVNNEIKHAKCLLDLCLIDMVEEK